MRNVLIVLVLTFLATTIQAQADQERYVILVSFDGFRHDYVEKYDAPHFKAFIAGGAQSAGLVPSFPSKTFPNHYSIVTGMYPGHHGLVDNSFYDEPRQAQYRMSNRAVVQDAYYYGGIPLWQWVQQHGMKSASYFWVGSEAPIQGRFPDYYYIYQQATPNTVRVDQAMTWLQMPDSARPRFITLYFSMVDNAGHDAGPESAEVRQAVMEADSLLGRLMAGLDTIPLPVDVILTSDHGMMKMSPEPATYIFMDDLVDMKDSTLVLMNTGTHLHIYTNDPARQATLAQDLQARQAHFSVYTHATMPAAWHYTHERVGDVLVAAEPGYYITTHREYDARRLRDPNPTVWGTHGYDPAATTDMNGIFYARGPHVKAGVTLPPMENVHVFPVVTRILGIPNPEIDGSAKKTKKMYRK